MIIEETFTVAAPLGDVATFLSTPEEVSACVPGVDSVEALGDDRYRATLRLHVGPIKTNFLGELSLDTSAAPDQLLATGNGRDRATGTTVRVDFAADLAETTPGRTTVCARADLTLRGRLAQFGSGVIKAVATEVVRDFADQVNARLAARVPVNPPVEEPSTAVTYQPEHAATAVARARRLTPLRIAGLLLRAARSALKKRLVDWSGRRGAKGTS